MKACSIRFWNLLIVLSLLVFLLPACGDDEKGTTPIITDTPPSIGEYNVLLISLDTLRADHLGAYGYKGGVSPKIDAFAKKSILFGRAYSHAPWTTPAHASMLTSLYPTVMGLKKYPNTGRIPDKVETMAEYFKAHGYRTHAVTEGGMVHAQFGFDQGFEKYFQSAKHVDHGIKETMKWLDANKKDKFFLFYHTYDIHRYDPPEEFRKKVVEEGEHRLAGDEELAKNLQHLENKEFVGSLTGKDLKYIISLYDASIKWVDRYVGNLLEYLQRNALLDKTIVVITSDHGEEFMERGRTGHGYSNFEEQIKVPMIVYHPDMKPGVRSTMFRHIDLLPTLAEVLKLPLREEWLGESLFTCMKEGDEKGGRKRFNFCEAGHANLRSIQSAGWKLIQSFPEKKYALYNLAKDPGEKKSVMQESEGTGRQLIKVIIEIDKMNRQLKPRFAGEGGEGDEDLPKELIDQLRKLGYSK